MREVKSIREDFSEERTQWRIFQPIETICKGRLGEKIRLKGQRRRRDEEK